MNDPKGLLAAISSFIQRHFLWLLLGCYALAALWPAPGLWIKDVRLGEITLFGQNTRLTLPMLLLALLLLNAGLGVRTFRPGELLRTCPLLAGGVAATLLIPLAFTFVAAQSLRAWHEPDEAQSILVGLALVASMPVAGSSTAWSQNNNGDLVVSLGLVLLSTLLSPLTTPAVMHAVGWLASGSHAEDLHRLASGGTGGFLAACVALPSFLGVLGRQAVGGARIDEAGHHLKLVNCLTLLVLNYSNGAVSLPQAVASPDWDFLALTLGVALALCVTAFALGWWLGGLFRADRPPRTALMFGVGMSNNGSGLVLAGATLAGQPRVMLPVIVYNLVQHLVAGAASLLLQRRLPGIVPQAGGPGQAPATAGPKVKIAPDG